MEGAMTLRQMALGLLLALAGCAKLSLPSVDLTRFDPRLAQDASGLVVSAETGVPVQARLYYQDNANEVVVSSGEGRFRFPPSQKSYPQMVGLDGRQARWLVIEAKGYRQGLQKVDPSAPADLLIKLEPGP